MFSQIRAPNEDEFYDAVEPSLESGDDKLAKSNENENQAVPQIRRLEHRLSAEVSAIFINLSAY